MTKRYGFTDWGAEAVLLPKPPKRQRTLPPPSDNLDLLAPSVAVDTSEAAADALNTRPGKARRLTDRHKILMVLAVSPKTREELEGATGLGGNTVRPRVGELSTGGYVRQMDATRLTSTGSPAHLLAITEKGYKQVGR